MFFLLFPVANNWYVTLFFMKFKRNENVLSYFFKASHPKSWFEKSLVNLSERDSEAWTIICGGYTMLLQNNLFLA